MRRLPLIAAVAAACLLPEAALAQNANAPPNASWRPMVEDGMLLMKGGAASPPPDQAQAGS